MADVIPVRVLVIDDDEALCRRLHGWLSEARFEPVTFTDPREGLRHAERIGYPLALVDLKLPQIEGAEVVAALRAASPATRILALAAFPDVPLVLAAFRAGACDLLEKPVQPVALVAALERQLAAAGLPARNEDDFNRRLGGRLRDLRTAAGRTLAQIASEVRISEQQLSQIELGKTGTTTWTLGRICAALQVSLARALDSF